MTERSKSPREIASFEAPIVFVIDDDESMRRALTNLFESVACGSRRSARVPNFFEEIFRMFLAA